MLLAGLLCLAVGTLVFGVQYIWVESAVGQVLRLDEYPGPRGQTFCEPVFGYEFAGESYESKRGVRESPCGWELHEELTIYFETRTPWRGYPLTFFGLLPLLLGVGAVLVLAGIAWVRLRGWARTIEERLVGVEVVPLRRARLGRYVGLLGTASCVGDPLVAPLTGRPCVAWRLNVYRAHEDERVCILSRGAAAKYALCDGERKVGSTEVVQLLLKQTPVNRDDFEGHELEAYLKASGLSAAECDASTIAFEVEQGVLSVGDRMVVYGRLEDSPDGLSVGAGEGEKVVLAAPVTPG